MSDIELCYADIGELSRRLRDGSLSPTELTRAFLDRIRALDPTLHAYATVLEDIALEDARRAEAELAQGVDRGPLHGVPVAVKDLCFTKGERTTAGMWIYRDFRPSYDSTVVTRLREAGAVMLGKLQLTEGAWINTHPRFVTPVNPWDSDRWAGASSNGSAAATAAGLCVASLGSDSGGSIRYPCAMNRLTGIKPSWGRVSVYGAFALSPSLDHLGSMARNAADAGHFLRAIAGPDPNDPMSLRDPVDEYVSGEADVRGLRIGVDSEAMEGVAGEVVSVVEDVAKAMESLGATIRRVRMPPWQALTEGFGAYCGAEAAVVHESTFPSLADDYGAALRECLEQGRAVAGTDMARLEHERLAYSGALTALFEEVDLLVVPVLITVGREFAARVSLSDVDIGSFTRFTTPFNFAGVPTITMPGGEAADGMAIAFQFVAPRLCEKRLVTAGRAFQRATDWHLKRPPLSN